MAPTSEFMILPDGRVMARNLTPELAEVLALLNPGDEQIRLRAGQVEVAGTAVADAQVADTRLGPDTIPP